jgi:membrane protein
MWSRARTRIERWLFAPPDGGSVAERARRFAQYPYALLRDLLGGRLNLHAMGLVYAALLALVPLVAFSFALLKVFGVQRVLEPLLLEFFGPMGASAAPLTTRVLDFANHVRGGLVGSVGLVLLVWTLIGTLRKVEDSLNFVWHVEVPRNFMRRIAEYLALLVVAPLLVAMLVTMARTPASAQLLAGLPLLRQLLAALVWLVPYLVISGGFAAIYGLIPNTKVRPYAALLAGLAAGLAWTAVGQLFTTFVVLTARLTIVYAGFAIFIAALLWSYVSWLILLLGAQLSFYLQNPAYLRIGLREPRLSSAENEQLALTIVFLVAQRHREGGPRWTQQTLAARLQMPGIGVARLVRALEAAGLLAETDADELLPGKDPASTPIDEVLAVARNMHSLHGEHGTPPPAAVAAALAQVEAAWRAQLGGRTVAQLLEP